MVKQRYKFNMDKIQRLQLFPRFKRMWCTYDPPRSS